MKETEKAGMNEETYFLDTYAIFELVGGSKNYEKYLDIKYITTIFNLAELNYNLKKKMASAKANEITKDFSKYIVGVELDDVINAMDLKTKHRKISIPDAIGYIVAKRFGVKFLTGDEDFKGFDNVEFVK